MLESKNSPPQYSTHFCKYISPNRTTMFLEILLFSNNNFAAFKASMVPSLTLFNKDMEGNGNSSNSNLYDCNDIYEAVMHIALFHWNRLGSF